MTQKKNGVVLCSMAELKKKGWGIVIWNPYNTRSVLTGKIQQPPQMWFCTNIKYLCVPSAAHTPRPLLLLNHSGCHRHGFFPFIWGINCFCANVSFSLDTELHKVSMPVTFEDFLLIVFFPRDVSVSEIVDGNVSFALYSSGVGLILEICFAFSHE